MSKDVKEPRIKTLKIGIPETCICPYCGKRQPFKKSKVYWKTIKDIGINTPLKLRVRMVNVKCVNYVPKATSPPPRGKIKGKIEISLLIIPNFQGILPTLVEF